MHPSGRPTDPAASEASEAESKRKRTNGALLRVDDRGVDIARGSLEASREQRRLLATNQELLRSPGCRA